MTERAYSIKLKSIEEIVIYFIKQDEAKIYRGHGCSSWKLQPCLFRNDDYSVGNIERYDINPSDWSKKLLRSEGFELMKGQRLRLIEMRALKLFLKNASSAGLPIPNRGLEYVYDRYSSFDMKGNYFDTMEEYDSWPEEKSLEYLALAQHYGLPTSLLDWSYNPFVSLFFAASSNITTSNEDTGYMSVWSFDYSKYLEYMKRLKITHGDREDEYEYIRELKKFKVFNPSAPENKNISAQKGCFTYISRTQKEVGWDDIFMPLDMFFEKIKEAAERTQKEEEKFTEFTCNDVTSLPAHELPDFLTEIQIPKTLSAEIILALKKFGIFYPTIYPSYDSCVKQVQIDLNLSPSKV